MKAAISKCKEDKESCSRVLESNINSIYMQSKLASLVPKKSFSVINSDYASTGINISSCENASGEYRANSRDTEFHAILFVNSGCGMGIIGPGLYVGGGSFNLKTCIGSGQGVSDGLYGYGAGVLGLGLGLTFGEGGICQVLTFKVLGVGAGAGILLLDGASEYWN
jgi:hypothetical protein